MKILQMYPTESFVYGLRAPDTEEFRYIGWTINPAKRLKAHLYMARKRKTKLYSWVKKLLHLSISPEIVVVESLPPHTLWGKKEQHWISHFKGLGHRLLNDTDGGTGGATRKKGSKLASEHVAKIRQSLNKSETKKTISKAVAEGWKDPLTRQKRISGLNKTLNTQKHKNLKSKIGKVIWENSSEEDRQKRLTVLKKALGAAKLACSSPESRKRASDSQKKRFDNPVSIKQISEAHKHRPNDSTCKCSRCKPRKFNSDRQKMSEAAKKLWATPEHRLKMSLAHQKITEV